MIRDEDFTPPPLAVRDYYDSPDDFDGLVQKFVNRVSVEQGREIGGRMIGVGGCGVYCCIRHTYEAKDEQPCHKPTVQEFREMTGIPYRDYLGQLRDAVI